MMKFNFKFTILFLLLALVIGDFRNAEAFTMAAMNRVRRWHIIPNTGAPPARSRAERQGAWTGSELIFFGGWDGTTAFGTGYRYNPQTQTWTQMQTTGAPAKRFYTQGVWTGTYYVIWGGQDETNARLADGGRYDLAGNSWTTIATTGAPSTRSQHTSTWTGSKVVVWGGFGSALRGDGALYDPATNTWSAIQTTNAPAARQVHTSVWTGSKVIIWGGYGSGSNLNSGSIYDPGGNTWTTMSTTGAPLGKNNHCAVWTGSKMIVWGGRDYTNATYYNTGGVYDLASDTWTTMSTVNAPAARICVNSIAIWDGTYFIVYGGTDASGTIGGGGMYDPRTDKWYSMNNLQGNPGPLTGMAYTWTGQKLIYWGGYTGTTYLNTGAWLY